MNCGEISRDFIPLFPKQFSNDSDSIETMKSFFAFLLAILSLTNAFTYNAVVVKIKTIPAIGNLTVESSQPQLS